MKIQKLIIHNIASIADATIDFSAKPLSDSDVFLITGKTGSGKSTILDAICLALYGTTPRLEYTNMDGKVDVAGKELPISNPGHLLKEGACECFVKLTFEGSNGVQYEAEWSISKVNDDPAGKLRDKKWNLTNLDSGTQYGKDRDIKPEIARAIGLSFDQFCRTTMLAQGEFTRFLNSKDDDKADILEKITGADIYSKIGAAIYRKAGEKETSYNDADKAVQGIVLLDSEQKDAKLADIDSKNKEIAAATSSRDACKAKADWLKEDNDLSAKKEDGETALKAAQDAVSAKEFVDEKTLVSSWKDTADVRRELTVVELEKGKADSARNSILSMDDRYSKVRSGLLFINGKRITLAAELAAVEKNLEDGKADQPVVQKSQVLETLIGTIDDGNRNVEALKKEIEQCDNELTGNLVPARDAALEANKKAQEQKGLTENALQTADNALRKAGLAEVRERIQALIAEQGDINLAIERIGSFETARESRNLEKAAIELASKELEDAKAHRDTKSNKAASLFSDMEAARIKYEAVSSATENWMGEVRNRLRVGDVCPVCMREITSVLPTDEEVASRLAPLKTAFEEAKEKYDLAKAELNKLEATIKVSDGALEKRKANFARDTTVNKARESALDALRKIGIDVLEDETGESLEKRRGVAQDSLSALREKEKAGQELEAAYERAVKADKEAGNVLAQSKAGLDVAERKVSGTEALKNQKMAIVESRNKDITDAIKSVDAIVKDTRWEGNWIGRLSEFRSEIKDAVEARERAITRESVLNEEIKEASRLEKAVGTVVADIESKVPEWKEIVVESSAEISNLEGAAATLRDDILIELQNERNAKDAEGKAEAKVKAFLDANKDYTVEILSTLSGHSKEEIDALDKEHKEAEDALKTASIKYQELQKQIVEHTERRPDLSDEDTVDSLEKQRKDFDDRALNLAGEVSVLEKELKDDEANAKKLGDLQKKADAAREEYYKWSRLSVMIGDATGKKFRKIAQSYVLGSLVQAANHYMKDLTDRYVLKVTPGTFNILLEDAYQGFASRPASTISGGESFLVSLSLALALSDIGDSLSVDTLFIDEGFGTLSGDPLNSAVNTLKTLHTKAGRHVGIISHIEELQNQIPVKIQLEQDPRSATSTVKIVPEE